MKLKKTMSVLLSAAMVAGMLPSAAFAEEAEYIEIQEIAEEQEPLELSETEETASGEEEIVLDVDVTEEESSPVVEEEILSEDIMEITEEAGFQVDVSEDEMEETIVITDSLDSEDLLNAYAYRQMYGEGAAFGSYAGDQLTGVERYVYDQLKDFAKKIADTGTHDPSNPGSTEISVNIKSYNITPDEYANRNISYVVVRSLLTDCPYEMYWYDKIKGATVTKYVTTGNILNRVVFKFPVCEEYSKTGLRGTYEIDTNLPQSISRAKLNANQIVQKYAGASDYEKLLGYKDEICEMTSYNYGATASADPQLYGNPWQLIWALDGDPSTTVVCEGYAKAFQYLCDLSSFQAPNLFCTSILGSTSGKHMWNIVTMDYGLNYLVDVTNCDSGLDLFMVGYQSGSVSDGYVVATGVGTNTITYKYDKNYLPIYGDVANLASFPYHEHVVVIDKAIEATCTKDGLTEGSHCSVNGEVLVPQEIIPAKGHSYGAWKTTKAATVFEAGSRERTCSVCGTKEKQTIAKVKAEVSLDVSGTLPLQVGKSVTLSALNLQKKDKVASWKSSNTKIATVSSKGVVKGVKAGTATITVTTKAGATAKVKVKVQKSTVKTSELLVGPSSTVTVKKEKYVKLTASVKPVTSTEKITFTSANTGIAKVSSKGYIRGIKAGTTQITVKSGTKKVVIKVKVK
ncbi:MAG: Ig-like domain-containing protein [Muricoprocola sp.]